MRIRRFFQDPVTICISCVVLVCAGLQAPVLADVTYHRPLVIPALSPQPDPDGSSAQLLSGAWGSTAAGQWFQIMGDPAGGDAVSLEFRSSNDLDNVALTGEYTEYSRTHLDLMTNSLKQAIDQTAEVVPTVDFWAVAFELKGNTGTVPAFGIVCDLSVSNQVGSWSMLVPAGVTSDLKSAMADSSQFAGGLNGAGAGMGADGTASNSQGDCIAGCWGAYKIAQKTAFNNLAGNMLMCATGAAALLVICMLMPFPANLGCAIADLFAYTLCVAACGRAYWNELSAARAAWASCMAGCGVIVDES